MAGAKKSQVRKDNQIVIIQKGKQNEIYNTYPDIISNRSISTMHLTYSTEQRCIDSSDMASMGDNTCNYRADIACCIIFSFSIIFVLAQVAI